MSFLSKLTKGIGGFITGGPMGAVGAVMSKGGGAGGRSRKIAARQQYSPAGFQPALPTQGGCPGGWVQTQAGCMPAPCPDGSQRSPETGLCGNWGLQVNPLAALPGGDPFIEVTRPTAGTGAAVMGRYGAALMPEEEMRRHRSCLPGMVLGDDGLCYNRRDVKNSERMWPKERAPLLTGGDRNAITQAARAARRITSTTKQLQKLGMLPKPKARTRRAPAQRQLPAGITVVDT